MHFNIWWKKVVHHYEPDVLLVALVAEHSKKLRQGGARILLQVHVVTGQQLLEEFSFFQTDSFQDELIIIRQIKYRSRCPWVSQLSQGFITNRNLRRKSCWNEIDWPIYEERKYPPNYSLCSEVSLNETFSKVFLTITQIAYTMQINLTIHIAVIFFEKVA